jgi:hypothetical protein
MIIIIMIFQDGHLVLCLRNTADTSFLGLPLILKGFRKSVPYTMYQRATYHISKYLKL